MRDGKWRYTIRAYWPPNRGGGLAIETVHATEISRDIEIAAFQSRISRHEIDYIDVIAHIEPFGTTRIWR